MVFGAVQKNLISLFDKEYLPFHITVQGRLWSEKFVADFAWSARDSLGICNGDVE
jgi:hypothetical protein